MDRIVAKHILQARKDYPCDACYLWLDSGYSLEDCKTSEQRLIVEAAQADKWKILRGQKYLIVVGVSDGRMVAYRARPGMQSVIEALDLASD